MSNGLLNWELSSAFCSQVKEAMQRIHDRGNIGKLILDVEKAPTPLVIKTLSEEMTKVQLVFPLNEQLG